MRPWTVGPPSGLPCPTSAAPTFRTVGLVRYLGPVPDGATRPQRFRGEDGQNYIVKFAENPDGPRVLATELIVAGLAPLVGAPCPEGVIVQVPEALVLDQPDLVASLCRTPSGGLHFGSKEVPNVSDGLARGFAARFAKKVVNGHELPALVTLDAWTRNADRSSFGNTLAADVGKGHIRVVGVDHADCFATSRWRAAGLRSLVGSWSGDVDREVAQLILDYDPFNNALGRLATVTEGMLRQIVAQVPLAWGLDTDDQDAIVQFLVGQRDAVPQLLAARRTTFAGWMTKGGMHD